MSRAKDSTTASDAEFCPDCGKSLFESGPQSLCPACLAGIFFAPAETEPLAFTDPIRAFGEMIGPYRLIEPLGEGGFGIVYRAHQTTPIERHVALKLIKPGLDSRMVVTRFEAERQALTMLDHPNIAHILDAGSTAEGRPFFVMELVEGLPITRHCQQHHLNLETRLALFLEVCSGVEHAHAKGIIHRDIKPSNVMVSQDLEALVKVFVIDFGIAKALWEELTPHTLFTNPGLCLGTPPYMSPEQILYGGLDIDIRADVYSLGALLYELLTDQPVLDEGETLLSIDQWKRRICEQTPTRPSRHLAASLPPQAVSIKRQIENELDWVALKALEKDRARRYQTVRELAEEIRHFLQDKPVLARPPNLAYLTLKFIRRYQTQVALAILGLITLIGFSLVGITLALKAERAERRTREAFSLADTSTANEKTRALAYAEAVALLCRALRMDDHNREAAYRLLTLLAEAPAGIPVYPTLHFSEPATYGCLLSFSDPPTILTAHPSSGTLKVWRSPHQPPQDLSMPTAIVAFAISAHLAATASTEKIWIWSLSDGRQLPSPPRLPYSSQGTQPTPQNLLFSTDENTLFVTDDTPALHAFHIRDGSFLWSVPLHYPPRHLAVSADNTRLALTAGTRMLLFDSRSGQPIADMNAQRHNLRGIAFSFNGEKCLATGGDTFARTLDSLTGARHGDLQHFEVINALSLSPTDETAVTGGADGVIRLRTLRGIQLGTHRYPAPIHHLQHAPNHALFAAIVTGENPLLSLLDARSSQPQAAEIQLGKPPVSIHFHPKDPLILVTHPLHATVYDTTFRQLLPQHIRIGQPISRAGFFANGLPFVTTADQQTYEIQADASLVKTDRLTPPIEPATELITTSLSGELQLSIQNDHLLTLTHTVRQTHAAKRIPITGSPLPPSLSPDASKALVATKEGNIYLIPLPPEDPTPLPEAFLLFAEGFAGWRFNSHNQMEPTPFHLLESARQSILEIQNETNHPALAWMQWLASAPHQRTVQPTPQHQTSR